jgi:pimeloyl-ACP methyl ester carboxylesterase
MTRILERAFRRLAAVRGGRRAVHPIGRTFHATVSTLGGHSYGVPFVDVSGDYAALVRLSRGAGFPTFLPDVHGAAVRVRDGGGPGVDLDLLVSTALGRLPLLRHLPAPRRRVTSPYTTMAGYGTRHGRRYLALLPDRRGVRIGADLTAVPTDGRARFLLGIAGRLGGWRVIGQLILRSPVTADIDERLAFDPLASGVAGLRTDGLLWQVRRMAYQGSRKGRGSIAGARRGRLSPTERQIALAAPAPADGFVSSRVHVAGLDLHLRARNTGDGGTPCILLHGLACSHRYLMPTARRLGARPVYVPDLPGYGLSDKPPVVLDVGEYAEVVAAVLDALATGPAAVLGNSFGGQVAVELARRRPDLVAALILVGPTTDPTAATRRGQLGRLIRDLGHEDWRQAPILAADLRDTGLRRVLTTLGHAVHDQVEPKLGAIHIPTLLARGSLDRIAPQRWLDRMARALADPHTVVLEGAAHNAVTTAGPDLGAAVDRFLSTHVTSKGGGNAVS